ncbi:Adenylate cyclase type 3 [Homalodisca vitripennis]|nr:Adenylate cyclase type 3 [Homalodisca vitripennis]
MCVQRAVTHVPGHKAPIWAPAVPHIRTTCDFIARAIHSRLLWVEMPSTLANVLLLLTANLLGLTSFYIEDRQQRTAFLETRQCLEMKLVIEEQSAEQLSQSSAPLQCSVWNVTSQTSLLESGVMFVCQIYKLCDQEDQHELLHSLAIRHIYTAKYINVSSVNNLVCLGTSDVRFLE